MNLVDESEEGCVRPRELPGQVSRRKLTMSVSRKILLIALSFALPIAVLVYLTVINIDANITFAQWELKGDEYQRPLEDLVHFLQSEQITLHSSGIKAAAETSKKIDSAFQLLEQTDHRLGVDLQFTEEGLAKRHREHERVAVAHQEWTELARELAQAGETSPGLEHDSKLDGKFDDKFDHLVSDLRTMITHIGDTSNLILDPDLDSYYLMDVTLLALPQTQDRLAQATQYGYEVLRRGGPTEPEKIRLAVYAAMLHEADANRVAGSSWTSVNEDAGFYGTSASLQTRLPPALLKYEEANGPFIQVIKGLADGSVAAMSPEAYLRSGLTAREESFAFWNTAVAEEDTLLHRRIAHFEQRRARSLLLAFAAVLAAGLLAFWLTRSITRPLLGLVASLSPGAVLLSVCVERIFDASENNFANRDETDLICQELDANCDAVRQAVAQLETQVKGATRT